MAALERTALLVVDAQRAFEDAGYCGRRNNPDCEANIAALIGAWRAADELARATATSLHGEFASVVATADVTA